MRIATVVAAAAPVAAALLALGTVAATGLSQRSDLPDWLAPRIYGFFLDSYPLFAFALVYGLVRLVASAAAPGPASLPRRVVWCVAGLAVLLVASLYPTFGGLVLRGAYGTGSMAFLTGQPLWLAYALGAAVAALAFGAILGLFGGLASGRWRPRNGWLARIGMTLCSVLALWFAAALLGLAKREGMGPWPHRAFTGSEAGFAALLILAAATPHALVVAFRGRADDPAP